MCRGIDFFLISFEIGSIFIQGFDQILTLLRNNVNFLGRPVAILAPHNKSLFRRTCDGKYVGAIGTGETLLAFVGGVGLADGITIAALEEDDVGDGAIMAAIPCA